MHRAAHLLDNKEQHDAATVRHDYTQLLLDMVQHQADAGSLSPAVTHFLKVTDSYEAGLFHCYEVPNLPCTNNDLEHYFGSARRQERRATGRKGASPGLVVRGSVRVIASVVTELTPFTVADIRPQQTDQWRELRRTLDYRHEARRAQLRFRRDPTAYLTRIEERLLQLGLPP